MRRCRQKGNSIAELGPALLIFFLVIFFPMLDLLSIGLQYGGGWYLNHMLIRELALRKQAECAQAEQEVTGNFVNSGLGKFLRLNTSDIGYQATYNTTLPGGVQTTVTMLSGMYYVGGAFGGGRWVPVYRSYTTQTQTAVNINTVHLATTVRVKPFLTIPFCGSVPGLGAPVTFTYVAERPREETQ